MLFSLVCFQDCQYGAVNEQARLAKLGAPWGPPTTQISQKKNTPAVTMISGHSKRSYDHLAFHVTGIKADKG